jgi:SAM-dependent methyltransferase
MKLCLICKKEFDHCSWTCPFCNFTPTIIDNFFSFAPHLAFNNDGLDANSHHVLNKLQENSFWFKKRNQLIQDMILRYFPNRNNVLEIGCGSGYVLSGIRAVLPCAKLTATEIYVNGLYYAAKKVSQPAEFLQVDARYLPFKNEFDLIGAFDVLEHIEEDKLVIKSIHQALKPGGGLILTVPQHPWLWSITDDIACHKRRYKRKQLSLLLRQEGFEILINTSFMFFLLPIMLIQRVIGNKTKDYDPAKELSLPKTLNKIFGILLECERRIIKAGGIFPIGGSCLVVARLTR